MLCIMFILTCLLSLNNLDIGFWWSKVTEKPFSFSVEVPVLKLKFPNASEMHGKINGRVSLFDSTHLSVIGF